MKTKKKKKVVIALDYDPTARKVAEAGFSLANAMDAEVILLHVITDPMYYSSVEYSPIMGFNGYMETSQFQANSIDSLKNATQIFLEKTRNHLGDKHISTMIVEGDLSESILKAAKDIHADFIVMGSHSRKWLENIVMGSVTEKVLRNTSIPLFIVPTKKQN